METWEVSILLLGLVLFVGGTVWYSLLNGAGEKSSK
tara:strand:- start:366 stop:473 length:108 start_codon:yes stop_codon:yes gene_type:complete